MLAFDVVVVRDPDLALQFFGEVDPRAHDLNIRLPDVQLFRRLRALFGSARGLPVLADLFFGVRDALCHGETTLEGCVKVSGGHRLRGATTPRPFCRSWREHRLATSARIGGRRLRSTRR